ncbi:DNA-processing protein DprA [Bacteroidota bacterium]
MKATETTKYLIALNKVPGVGDVVAKKLVAYCGSVQAIFSQNKSMLQKIPGIGKVLAESVYSGAALDAAEKEIANTQKLGIRVLNYLEPDYPHRLKNCVDAPIILYTKGNGDLNPQRSVCIVGTRNATVHGKALTEKIVEELTDANVTVISGLAYGIDIAAHKAALKFGLPTIAGLAHGLDRVYPSIHQNIANEMLETGALVSDFTLGTKPDRANFPKRNRVVAGMSDATVVIEAARKGGALITAEIANSYNRDVFSVPGRPTDPASEGCNQLIMHNKAALVTSGKELLHAMGWNALGNTIEAKSQRQLPLNLTPDQENVVMHLKEKEARIDQLALKCQFAVSKTATVLLELEFEGLVASLPGKVYKLL